MPKPQICPLRQTCEICGVEYGRKIMVSGSGKGYLASEKLFKQTTTCGKDACRCAKTRKTRLLNQKHASERLRASESAYSSFVGA